MTRVQVCGIRDLDEALMCEEAGVDALGFVNVEGRNRNVPLKEIKRIIESLDPVVETSLIGFPATAEEVIGKMEQTCADTAQIYTLGPNEADRIRLAGFAVIRAVTVDVETRRINMTLEELKELACVCDAILFEPSKNGMTGGLGIGYDRKELLSAYIGTCHRFLIAGGLTPKNVQEALELDPHGVHVSSGVETRDGEKDLSRIQEFMRRCKA